MMTKLLILPLLAILSIGYSHADCTPSSTNPQGQICDATWAMKVQFLKEEKTKVFYKYLVKVIRVFKGEKKIEYFNKKEDLAYIYSPIFTSVCGRRFPVNTSKWLITGYIRKPKTILMLTLTTFWNVRYRDLTRHQKLSLICGTYAKSCNCKDVCLKKLPAQSVRCYNKYATCIQGKSGCEWKKDAVNIQKCKNSV